MIHSKKIVYPDYTVKIDYVEEGSQLAIVVLDATGEQIEGLYIGDESDEEKLN